MSFDDDDNDLKVPESKHKKTPEGVCVLDLLNITKPLKESCFSEKQIDILFTLWRDFMYERFKSNSNPQEAARAREDVERLYSTATTTKQKYNSLRLDQNTGVGGALPAMSENEKSWVMGHQSPTPFIAFIRKRPDVMEQLSMSFKPVLLHGGMLEAPDMIMIMQRYAYWLRDDKDRSLNILGVTDDSTVGATNVSTDSMVGNLQQNWVNFRFHAAVLNEGMHWRGLLIDRKSHTFEYYDPLGNNIDLTNTNSPLSVQVERLYETARLLDHQIITRSMHSARRGYHKHQTSGTECGMYVILFFHTRTAQQKSFEEFANTEIKNQTCKDLKSLFFTMPDESEMLTETKSNKDYRLQFGAYDIRLAGIDFVNYIGYVISITNDFNAKNKLLADKNKLVELIKNPGDYIVIRVEGMSIQKDLLSVLPPQYKTYSGSDIWFNIVQSIVSDPLTKYLRVVSSEKGGSRSKNTVRRKVALKFYHDIVGWSLLMGAPVAQVTALNTYTREALDKFYIPALLFESDNQKKFEIGMPATNYIRECMTKQDGVSFGVHFIRYIYDVVTKQLKIPIQSELNTKFVNHSIITKPVTNMNMDEIKSVMNRCDATLNEAYQLLRTTFTDKMAIQTDQRKFAPVASGLLYANPSIGNRPLGDQPIGGGLYTNPPTGNRPLGEQPAFGQLIGQQPINQYPSMPRDSFEGNRFMNNNNPPGDILERIISLNKIAMENGALKPNSLEPFNFPLDVPYFTTEQVNFTLPATFNMYSVTAANMRVLLQSSEFLIHYAMGVLIMIVNIANQKVSNTLSIYITFYSLIQFFNATDTFSEVRKIICDLLVKLHNALIKSPLYADPKVSSLLQYSQQFVKACSLSGPASPQFLQSVLTRERQYSSRGSRGFT